MKKNCECFADAHGLVFNLSKTQFIQFYRQSHLKTNSSILFCGQRLPIMKEVVHLGHILTHDLCDDCDIQFKCGDMVRKVNSLLCLFPNLPPVVITHLFRSLCLSLYGCPLWNISSKAMYAIEISFNKILRRIWKLPYDSHTKIVHCTAQLQSLFNVMLQRTTSLFITSQKCSSNLVKI